MQALHTRFQTALRTKLRPMLYNYWHYIVHRFDNIELNVSPNVIHVECCTKVVHYTSHIWATNCISQCRTKYCVKFTMYYTLHATLYTLFFIMLRSVCKTLNTTLYKPSSTMLRSTLHEVYSSVAQMLYTKLYIVLCNLWFTMVAQDVSKIHNALRCTRRYANCLSQCCAVLQNVKHHVVQAIVDNVTLNLARSVIQCRTNNIVMHKCCAIVYNSLQPVVHKAAQNVNKIHNALRCTQRYTNCF